MINQEQQQKLDDLKQQQQKLEESIKNLEDSLKESPKKLLTSQLTDEGEEARRKYFNGNVGILCACSDMDNFSEVRQGYFAFYDGDGEFPYNFLDGFRWKYARQVKPQKGVWYWREDVNDVPPKGSYGAILLNSGGLWSGLLDTWGWTLCDPVDEGAIIAYMLL
jgi:hypothetical protein